MNTERVEKLKDKSRAQAYGILVAEERQVLEKAGIHNCLWYGKCGIWESQRPGSPFNLAVSYILKPDYQLEPEYEDIEIVSISRLLVLKRESPGNSPHIADVVTWARFAGFFRKNHPSPVAIDRIATLMREEKKVYARFVKE